MLPSGRYAGKTWCPGCSSLACFPSQAALASTSLQQGLSSFRERCWVTSVRVTKRSPCRVGSLLDLFSSVWSKPHLCLQPGCCRLWRHCGSLRQGCCSVGTPAGLALLLERLRWGKGPVRTQCPPPHRQDHLSLLLARSQKFSPREN